MKAQPSPSPSAIEAAAEEIHPDPIVEQPSHIDRQHEEDHMYSQNLARETADVPMEYFLGANYVLTMISMSLVVVSAYFGFAVPASVVTFINADIGTSNKHIFIYLLYTAEGLEADSRQLNSLVIYDMSPASSYTQSC